MEKKIQREKRNRKNESKNDLRSMEEEKGSNKKAYKKGDLKKKKSKFSNCNLILDGETNGELRLI